MRNRKKTVVVLLLASLLGFAGCNYLAGRGAMYDIIYSSEYSRDPYTREEMTPVQGNDEDWQLRLLPAADDDPAALQLLDAAGQLLCTVPAAGLEANRNTTLALRAEAGLGQTVWLTAERWAKSSYNGYIDGGLQGGRLWLVSVADGSVLLQAETQPGELFLTACGTRCYFYYPGKTSRRREDIRPAQIYWRDFNCWLLPHPVCTFDYVGSPVLTTAEGEELAVDRLRFYVQEDSLRLDFTCYEQTDAENDRWGFVVKDSVETPLLPAWPLPQPLENVENGQATNASK